MRSVTASRRGASGAAINLNSVRLSAQNVSGGSRIRTSPNVISADQGIGEFTGGALVTEKGDRYEARNEWMGPFDFRNTLHWNLPILSGTKISLVAFQSNRF